jgi:hypothetical protein
MKRSTKAALLSGLVFPGIGHIYLKLYVHGTILLVGAASAIYFILYVAVNTALEVVEKIQSGGIPLTAEAITELVSQQSSGSEESTNIATIALLICWVIGIADSYRQGRAQEKVEEATTKKET